MKYVMKFGILYGEDGKVAFAKIKNTVVGPVRKICSDEGEVLLQTDIHYIDMKKEHCEDVRNKEYTLRDNKGIVVGSSRPGYAQDEDPDENGWPAFRLPKVDHAEVILEKIKFSLNMYNSQYYVLRNTNGEEVLSILHKGITGGWFFDDKQGFAPEILCAIFVFCRYMEQENELLIV